MKRVHTEVLELVRILAVEQAVLDSYVSRPLPPGRQCAPLSDFSHDHRRAIAEQAMADECPPPHLEFGFCRMPSRAWYEWHWHRGIDPDKRRQRLPTWTRDQIIERDGLTCRLCGGDVELADVHIDHIHPVARGGTDAHDNLQVTHSRCNMRKGARV